MRIATDLSRVYPADVRSGIVELDTWGPRDIGDQCHTYLVPLDRWCVAPRMGEVDERELAPRVALDEIFDIAAHFWFDAHL